MSVHPTSSTRSAYLCLVVSIDETGVNHPVILGAYVFSLPPERLKGLRGRAYAQVFSHSDKDYKSAHDAVIEMVETNPCFAWVRPLIRDFEHYVQHRPS